MARAARAVVLSLAAAQAISRVITIGEYDFGQTLYHDSLELDKSACED